jgi:hypothetical protein
MKYLSARQRFLPFHIIDVYAAAVYKTKGHNFLSNKKNFIVVGWFSMGRRRRRHCRALRMFTAVTCHPCLATPTTLNAQMTGKPQLSGFSLTSNM